MSQDPVILNLFQDKARVAANLRVSATHIRRADPYPETSSG
jgi:hypothetical protein